MDRPFEEGSVVAYLGESYSGHVGRAIHGWRRDMWRCLFDKESSTTFLKYPSRGATLPDFHQIFTVCCSEHMGNESRRECVSG